MEADHDSLKDALEGFDLGEAFSAEMKARRERLNHFLRLIREQERAVRRLPCVPRIHRNCRPAARPAFV